MILIRQKSLKAFRARTYRLSNTLRLRSADQAVNYVNERGVIFFWPVKSIDFPSLWTATAGDRPVADAHDDPGHVTWGWKDGLLGSKRWYYAKILRHRGTFISNDLAPSFYALSENYGSPDEDYLIQYQEGRLTQEAKQVYEVLLEHGILNTIDLRKVAHLSSPENEGRFNKALDQLMADFKILPVGIAEAGAWHYAYQYDTVAHHYPGLSEAARPISLSQARSAILRSYFQSVGIACQTDIQRLFQWPIRETASSLSQFVDEGWLLPDIELEGGKKDYYGLVELS